MIVPAIGFAPPEDAWNRFAPAVQRRLEQQGVTAAAYPAWRTRIERETEQRERDGEGDHLIHYALLSRAFTQLEPIEPALSAKQFVERGAIPKDAALRLAALQTTLHRPTISERLLELKAIAQGRDFPAEYVRAMRFLYAKEFEHQTSYARRGHSTDTAVAANFAVWHGLHVLHAIDARFAPKRVLVIGPGLDFAPRTAFQEMARPQSYQPFAILDALLELGIPAPAVHCFDINSRVLHFFETFAANPVLELPLEKGNSEFTAYSKQLGTRLGSVQSRGPEKAVTVRLEYTRVITAEHRNIVTDEAAETYDLIVATNLLVYYEGAELTVALAHIAQSLAPGGYFLHNDLRPDLDGGTQAAGLQAVAARTVQISAATFDSFAIYRK